MKKSKIKNYEIYPMEPYRYRFFKEEQKSALLNNKKLKIKNGVFIPLF